MHKNGGQRGVIAQILLGAPWPAGNAIPAVKRATADADTCLPSSTSPPPLPPNQWLATSAEPRPLSALRVGLQCDVLRSLDIRVRFPWSATYTRRSSLRAAAATNPSQLTAATEAGIQSPAETKKIRGSECPMAITKSRASRLPFWGVTAPGSPACRHAAMRLQRVVATWRRPQIMGEMAWTLPPRQPGPCPTITAGPGTPPLAGSPRFTKWEDYKPQIAQHVFAPNHGARLQITMTPPHEPVLMRSRKGKVPEGRESKKGPGRSTVPRSRRAPPAIRTLCREPPPPARGGRHPCIVLQTAARTLLRLSKQPGRALCIGLTLPH